MKQHLLEVVDAEQRKARRRTAAEEWLIEFLAGGPRKSVEVYAEGAKCEHEFSKPQLKRAKANVARAVRISDVGGDHGDGCWYWELKPEHAVSAAATEARLDDAEHRPRVRGNPFADLAANDDDDESD